MADLIAQICNILPNFFADFLSADEEDALLGESREEDDFIFISTTSIFSRRTLARISEFFEETVPLYHGDVFRSHFRMTLSTFETLCQLLVPSEHIPKGNAFGRRPIDPQKQIAVAVWALANQESCRQISDRFNVTMSMCPAVFAELRMLLWIFEETLFSGQEVTLLNIRGFIKHRSTNRNILNGTVYSKKVFLIVN